MQNDLKLFLKLMAVSFALFIALVIISCNDKPVHSSNDKPVPKQPVYVAYFNAGDTLLQDMAIPDTLIVIDAIGLNKDMGKIEQGIIEATDQEIATVFYNHCKIK